MVKINMLGTGRALATKCYNTCFTLQNGREHLLVDGGGGNGILAQMEKLGIAPRDIRGVFVTHAHTDHVLGVVWALRVIATDMLRGGTGEAAGGDLPVYCHAELAATIKILCELTLPADCLRLFGRRIFLIPVEDGETRNVAGLRTTFFDIRSKHARQFGFSALLPDGRTLACLGDEPYKEHLRPHVENSHWLLAEAFCLHEDRERFLPCEKGHGTARDAARRAEELGVKNLLLYHTEDSRLAERKKLYTREAEAFFSGGVFVPDDLEVLEL